jgi:hypothetical protein
MIGKLAITTSYGVIYIFSAELFPTSIRNVAVGACSMSARYFHFSLPSLKNVSFRDSRWLSSNSDELKSLLSLLKRRIIEILRSISF